MSSVRRDWLVRFAVASLLTGCSIQGTSPGEPVGRESTFDEPPTLPVDNTFTPTLPPLPCDRSLGVKSDGRSLVVQDPEILARFTLERVLGQLIAFDGDRSRTPLSLLQRAFDTENTVADGVFADVPHCDSPDNLAFANGPPTDCPRAEGALARSAGLFVPGHPDYFAPVALVNRFDLTPSNLRTCGEYRIVFAKWSGRNDPNNRLFLIFEGALTAQGSGFDLMACQPVARLWAGLEQQKDLGQIAARLEAFYFTGLPGFLPLVHPDHFGLLSNEQDAYDSQRGQIRISQRMQEPWEMREFHLTRAKSSSPARLFFAPVTVKNNPLPGFFDPGSSLPRRSAFESDFMQQVLGLSDSRAWAIRMALSNMFSAGQSALEGPSQTDYLTRAQGLEASSPFLVSIAKELARTGRAQCPPDDPLTPRSIIARATTQTCAGCHAPERFLGPERKLGCGVVWPKSLGGAHIDEMGKLSPALTDVLLPRRAAVMTTYLQACDMDAILGNMQPSRVVIPK